MDAFEQADIIEQQRASGKLYLEFLKVSSLSTGVYILAAGTADLQQPHTEDEVYYIAQGVASIQVGSEDRPVRLGSIIYVPANVPHRFHDITQDLTALVFFAPAEYTNRKA